MVQLISENVRVGAESFYQESYSNPLQSQYIYAYRICITNQGSVPVRLLNRTWTIIDGAGQRRTVEGDGVIGEQPEILPGQSHEYTSWVQFETPVGVMEGAYGMVRENDQGQREHFSVGVPRFQHLAPTLLN